MLPKGQGVWEEKKRTEGLKEEKSECEKASPVALNSHWFKQILSANVISAHLHVQENNYENVTAT